MPLFEYECRGCGHHFEFLTREGQTPACPSCKGDDLQKLLSVFAVSGGSHERAFDVPASGACGHCGDPRGPGSCSVN
jgi:putative FmdB family regulatory protein